MQQGIKKLQWLEYLKVVFLEILNPLLCQVFDQVTIECYMHNILSRDNSHYFTNLLTTLETIKGQNFLVGLSGLR